MQPKQNIEKMEKPIIPTPIKNIDRILKALHEAQALNYEDTKSKSDMKDDEETQRALKKLYKDGYAERTDGRKEDYHLNLKDGNFMITYDGVIHHLKQGYEGEIIRQYNKDRQLNLLEEHQKHHRNWMTLLTLTLSFGTSVAAIYYFLEIWKSHQCVAVWSLTVLVVLSLVVLFLTVFKKQSK